jgi:hypothetical protein
MIDLKRDIGLISGIGLFDNTLLKNEINLFFIIVHADSLNVVYS